MAERLDKSRAYGLGKSTFRIIFGAYSQLETTVSALHVGSEWPLWAMNWARHTIQGLVIQQVFTLVLFYAFSRFMNDDDLFASFGFGTTSKPVVIGLFLFWRAVWTPIQPVLMVLVMCLSRYSEFQADAFAVQLGFGNEVQTALAKVFFGNLANLNPDCLYSAYHDSQPPLVDRLTAIAIAKVQASDNKKTQ